MNFQKSNNIFFYFGLFVVLITSCATYYQKNEDFMQALYAGRLNDANNILLTNESKIKRKDILLYYFNRGTVYWLKGDIDSSNTYFQKADFYIEDYRKKYLLKTLTFISNPTILPYGGEGFEQILLHYYTTLNYAQKGDLDAALVECKRMMLKLQKITDYYNGDNKYKRDAFAHNLMGMIYDAQKDYNSAFISYRNALEIYEAEYSIMLNTPTPPQLKKDIIRTAHLVGFYEEQKMYENRFNLTYESEKKDNGTLLFFWNNGLGPIKTESSFTFAITPAGNGYVNFNNVELGIKIPYYVGDKNQREGITALKFIRVAYPKYITRKPLYHSATCSVDSSNISSSFNLAENIDAIAYRSLQDRMVKELTEALLRLAIKQSAAEIASEGNEGLGTALSIVNAITEQADTRNWQLLPYSINYCRLSIPSGNTQLTLTTIGKNNINEQIPFTFDIEKGKTTIATFQSLQFLGYSNK